MSSRRPRVAVKRPRYAAVFFPGDESTSIVPVTKLPEGDLAEQQTVNVEWDGVECPGKIIKLSDDRSVLVQAEIMFIQQHVPPEESMALIFSKDKSTGVCPTSWLVDGEKTEGSQITVDWDGTTYETTILKLSFDQDELNKAISAYRAEKKKSKASAKIVENESANCNTTNQQPDQNNKKAVTKTTNATTKHKFLASFSPPKSSTTSTDSETNHTRPTYKITDQIKDALHDYTNKQRTFGTQTISKPLAKLSRSTMTIWDNTMETVKETTPSVPLEEPVPVEEPDTSLNISGLESLVDHHINQQTAQQLETTTRLSTIQTTVHDIHKLLLTWQTVKPVEIPTNSTDPCLHIPSVCFEPSSSKHIPAISSSSSSSSSIYKPVNNLSPSSDMSNDFEPEQLDQPLSSPLLLQLPMHTTNCNTTTDLVHLHEETTPRDVLTEIQLNSSSTLTKVTDANFFKLSLNTISLSTPSVLGARLDKEPPAGSEDQPIPDNIIKDSRCKAHTSCRKFAVSLFRMFMSLEDVYLKNVRGKVYQTTSGIVKGQINLKKMEAIRTAVFHFYPVPASDQSKTWTSVVRAIDKANWQFHQHIRKTVDFSALLQ